MVTSRRAGRARENFSDGAEDPRDSVVDGTGEITGGLSANLTLQDWGRVARQNEAAGAADAAA